MIRALRTRIPALGFGIRLAVIAASLPGRERCPEFAE
jgi:hypothetical protein